MFKMESYVTPILLSYVDKYVRDFKPADAQVSLWGGGVALHNLVLKGDVLQREVALPFTLVSGRIHELLIQVPWTKIMSEPIIVTIDTIECVLSLNPPDSPEDSPPPDPSRKTQVVEAPPGYMQALVRRIVSNIALRVHHLIVKYVQDDIVMSLNVKHLAVDSTGVNWEPAFADIDQNLPVLRRLVTLDDLTLCLDKTDADGKIRFYKEPLLYRCQLDLRVLTRLVSANTRRASSLCVQLRSSKLAWSVTNDQLVLLLRLLRERPSLTKQPSPVPKQPVVLPPSHQTSANSAEPARSDSWSEWAWSWLPTWMDREGGAEEAPTPASPTPLFFTAYLDDISLVFKVMEIESGNRKRARGVLVLSATHAAAKTSMWSPTMLRVRVGARRVTLRSHGKCVCGHVDYDAALDEPTIFLNRAETECTEEEEEWKWPEEDLSDKIEPAEAADEKYRSTHENTNVIEGEMMPGPYQEEFPMESQLEFQEENDELFAQMAPLLYLEYTHDRSPPQAHTNPYENPPADFQYSDWVEECVLKVKLEPIEFRVCMGLIHRFSVLKTILQDLPPVIEPELPMRILTVEECDALIDNLPQRRIKFEARGVRVRILPWDHSLLDRATPPPLVLEIDLPKNCVVVTGPLYPHRVCSAACQLPEDNGPLWRAARLHVTVALTAIQATISSPAHALQKPCARADIRSVTHVLLNKAYFKRLQRVEYSYSIKIKELNICGSAPRLMAACEVPMALFNHKVSAALKSTTLVKDALNDEEAVAVDATLENLCLRGYLTKSVNTHNITLQAARATAYHEPKGTPLKQAWLFSGPDTPVSTPYIYIAVQWCTNADANSFDYLGVWSEPTVVSADPMFITWLAYKPSSKTHESSSTLYNVSSSRSMTSNQHLPRRRLTPPSSSGRGASRTGSGAELVHVRQRSGGSGSEPSEKKDSKPPTAQRASRSSPEHWWAGGWLVPLHERMSSLLLNVELGLVLVYVTTSSVPAVDYATIRDAMEGHVVSAQPVLTISLGRLLLNSNTSTKRVWMEITPDGPTFLSPKFDQAKIDTDSFPWKMRLADVSCYTLEVKRNIESPTGLRSTLKTHQAVLPRTVLELVTTTITLSVVTKTLQMKPTGPKNEHKKQAPEVSVGEKRMRYFNTGMTFKPSTLKEFVRGPARKKKPKDEEPKPEPPVQPAAERVPVAAAATAAASGPVVSIGFHVHADTPPIIVRIDPDQVHVVAAAVHCLNHILTLLKKKPLTMPRHGSTISLHKSIIRSVSDIEELQSQSEETASENRSDLIPIFEAQSARSIPLKTFFWLQWVVSRATLVVATEQVKLAVNIDDIITTVDLQTHYNQLKIKLSSASVRHYERTSSEEWSPGVLGGRLLEVREPAYANEEGQFMVVTITEARISNLPATWKEELHPKLLEEKSGVDSMWEIYASLAPLEAVVQPKVLEKFVWLMNEFKPRSFCPLQTETTHRSKSWQWPFCYVTAGGLRLLIASDEEDQEKDDTLIFFIGDVIVNPHPDNPICRHPIIVGADSGWQHAGSGLEGRQYEMMVKNAELSSAQFRQLIYQETTDDLTQGTGGENPAFMWSQPNVEPVITYILHAVDMSCVAAPALFSGGALACGPAVEVNLITDCSVELSVQQVALLQRLAAQLTGALTNCEEMGLVGDEEGPGVCPYAPFIMGQEPEPMPTTQSETVINELTNDLGRSLAADSGVDTSFPFKLKTFEDGTKKSFSVVFAERMSEASEYLEVFVTMGTIELSLYVTDDDSPNLAALRPPRHVMTEPPAQPAPSAKRLSEQREEKLKEKPSAETASHQSKSITEITRKQDVGNPHMLASPYATEVEGNLPLIHITLHQPNMYYWKKKTQKSLQVSLFNAWVGLGGGPGVGQWQSVLLSTARGVPDPISDIPPALATMKFVAPMSGWQTASLSSLSFTRGTIQLDVERPVLLELSTDKLNKLNAIFALIDGKREEKKVDLSDSVLQDAPFLYKLRRTLLSNGMESITVQTSQIVLCGSEGTVSWDGASLQLAAGTRPERLHARALATALLVSAGAPGDRRHVVLHPLMMGVDLEASWEAWRRAEGGSAAREPTVRVGVEVDRVTLDLRPEHLAAFSRMHKIATQLANSQNGSLGSSSSVETLDHMRASGGGGSSKPPSFQNLRHRTSIASSEGTETMEHYYKDDLRSGAFKIVSGGQLPMAYQVMLHNNAVSWRYPQPRAITRIVAFPLPGYDEEVECVLELYSPLLSRWEPHTYFKIPVNEPRELQLHVPPPDAMFAVMWRFRACLAAEPPPPPYEFNFDKFAPRQDPLLMDNQPEPTEPHSEEGAVSAEQLSGVLRVDSYFAPRLLPRTRVFVRLAEMEVFVHNSLPQLSSVQATAALEGYYVSKPLMRAHRVLSVTARDVVAHAHLGSPAGTMLLLDTALFGDILECATGTMEQLVDEFRVQAGVSLSSFAEPRVRLVAAHVRVALHVARLRTLHALAHDWLTAFDKYILESPTSRYKDEERKELVVKTKHEMASETAAALEGRVSLWLHNTCAGALRLGQQGTEEVVPLGSGARLAYRWRSPTAPKRLRLAIAGPSTAWLWSASVPFTAGCTKVRMEGGGAGSMGCSPDLPGTGVYLHVKVEEKGACRLMQLSGRLVLANMLRLNLLYKVRARMPDSQQWHTVCSGELMSETVGRSVTCAAECEMVLKVKFMNHDTGWSGDIPLKECPKENVPWLVKVPNEGEMAFTSVWCRVARARNDGRILATLWPLYVLRSHLPLDTDVLIVTDRAGAAFQLNLPGPPTPGLSGAGPAGVGAQKAGLSGAGLSGAGLQEMGPPGAGLSGAGPAGMGPPGAGPVGAGPPGAGPVGAGPPGAGPPGAGPPGAGPPGAGPAKMGPSGPGPVGVGPPGTGPVGAGSPGVGLAEAGSARAASVGAGPAGAGSAGVGPPGAHAALAGVGTGPPRVRSLLAQGSWARGSWMRSSWAGSRGSKAALAGPGSKAALAGPGVDAAVASEPGPPPPLVQTTEGRGTCTHLIAPGTTSARHTLSFQYRNIECPVTREAVPLHYGVTETSVFEKHAPVNCVTELTDVILEWLERSGRNSNVHWPYSVVTKHWPDVWRPAQLQPRCDIAVRYEAVRAGGGCSLEVQLCPHVLMCNAATMPLTLRAHDAAPLCKLEPGTAISPPSIILQKPFFISVEMGRETFVSGELEVCSGEPGRYGAPPPGQVALDHAADFAIQCNNKVALLTLYYEIKHDINVFGISSTYVLINRLDSNLLVSAVAVPADVNTDVVLRPKTFKVVEPIEEGSIHGTPLTRFLLNNRWRGGSTSELHTYLCIAFPAGNYPARAPVPIQLGSGPVRRSIGLIGADDKSVAVVVSQVRHESRWLVEVAHDPCPQFVVHNRTRAALAIAQPAQHTDEPSTSLHTVTPECRGVRWWCLAVPSSHGHYSSPAYCARYPPPVIAAPLDHSVPFLTFAKYSDDEEPGWCPPVAVTDGEQLLPLFSGVTIKLRVRTYPHSTLLELQDVDQNDISASDIRRRLLGAFNQDTKEQSVGLERIGAVSELLVADGVRQPSRVTLRETSAVLIDLAPDPDIGDTDDLLDTNEAEGVIRKTADGSHMLLFTEPPKDSEDSNWKKDDMQSDMCYSEASFAFQQTAEPDFEEGGELWRGRERERARCVLAGVEVEMAASADVQPLLALHLDRSALLLLSDNKKSKAILSVSDIQIDNLHYESGQYDFGVVASTRAMPLAADRWPPLWNMFAEREVFETRHADARLLVVAQHDSWTVVNCTHREMTELELRLGPLALYVEDAYVTALVKLFRMALPAGAGAGAAGDVADMAAALAEIRALRSPLRLRMLHVHPLDLTLTLHTAVRMYIALDQSPLLLSAFRLNDMMTSTERLTHALTVHYLSAAILGAGWVVGGLELLGAPGALAARVGGATGGVRGVASAAAAALLRSLSAWASSLARNLDLLAGDEEHARRAAAARRRPPPSFAAGLMAGITNFGINILGAVGGLAHHPLVGVAVGETGSGATALRRGLLGAFAKPLSATADLVAFAGHGLLRQAGWDPVPQPRRPLVCAKARAAAGWRRDCVRWAFRLADVTALSGFEAQLDGAPLQLIVSHKILVVADLETERIVEMIDLRFCTVGDCNDNIIKLYVTQRRQSKMSETRTDEDDEYQISVAAMARVARYTGAERGPAGVSRLLALHPSAARAHSLHAALAAAARHNSDSHFPVL